MSREEAWAAEARTEYDNGRSIDYITGCLMAMADSEQAELRARAEKAEEHWNFWERKEHEATMARLDAEDELRRLRDGIQALADAATEEAAQEGVPSFAAVVDVWHLRALLSTPEDKP